MEIRLITNLKDSEERGKEKSVVLVFEVFTIESKT